MKRFFLMSLLIHLFVVFGVLVYARTLPPNVIPGDSDHQSIHAFIYNSTQAISNRERQTNAINKKQVEQHERLQSRAASKGKKENSLLALLHNAIQKQQHYPDSAFDMEREGRVTVQFKLFADGSVSDVAILHSSGTESLDNSALAAVRNAAPFVGVAQYVHEANEYSVDVVFAL